MFITFQQRHSPTPPVSLLPPGPRWASWNLGIFICIRCAGIHRNLGVHISKVKSVNLDQWTQEQVQVKWTASVLQVWAGPQGRALTTSHCLLVFSLSRRWGTPKPGVCTRPSCQSASSGRRRISRPRPSSGTSTTARSTLTRSSTSRC